MVTDCYVPTWCELELDGGEKVTALVFVMNPQHPLFEEDTSYQVIAPLIASASGPLGTNAQYLFALDNELKHHGMQDDCIGDLVRCVQQWLQQNRTGGIGSEATAWGCCGNANGEGLSMLSPFLYLMPIFNNFNLHSD